MSVIGKIRETVPSAGGLMPVVLDAGAPVSSGRPAFVEATFLPGRGMSLIKVCGHIPRRSEVDPSHSLSTLDDVGERLSGGLNDFTGEHSFCFGVAPLNPLGQ